MIDVRPGSVTAAIRALFPRSGHAWRRCFATLAGASGGRIVTDDPDAPTWAVAHELSDDGVLFVGGALTRSLVTALVEQQRAERTVVVALGPDDPLLPLLPPDPDYDGADIDFEDRAPEIDLERLIEPPVGLRLARIDAELIERCIWTPWMAAGPREALEYGLGYCLLDGDLVVSEAFSGPVVEGALEMGTITREEYQRKGLATVVCARTILECERLGYSTWWNTGVTNVASATLARKLGYRTERQYRLMAWYGPGVT